MQSVTRRLGCASPEADAISGTINIELGDFTLTSVTGWRKNNESVRQDFDSASINFFDTLRIQRYEQFSQEIRFAGDVTDWMDIVLGAYYFDSQYTLRQTSFFGFLGPGASAFGGAAPVRRACCCTPCSPATFRSRRRAWKRWARR